MYDSKDKVVLVTGGAAGIGAGVVKAFLEGGAKHVAALDIDSKNGKSLQKELTTKYGADKFKFYNCDITTNDLEEAYDSVLKDHGYIDAVVNCAGIMNDEKKVYLKEIAVNISALITSSLKAYDIMREDHGGKGGTIINISSIVGLFKASLLPVYAATKSAVLQFSNCLGSKPHYPGSGVRVLTICFGVTDTSLLSTTKMHAFDEETDVILVDSLSYFPIQTIDSAVSGLMDVFKLGDGGSTWLVTSNRPAEDITKNITEAYDKMSQGVLRYTNFFREKDDLSKKRVSDDGSNRRWKHVQTSHRETKLSRPMFDMAQHIEGKEIRKSYIMEDDINVLHHFD